MRVRPREYMVSGWGYTIRSARAEDAGVLPQLKAQIDRETEFLDRQPGEGMLTEKEFAEVVKADTAAPNSLFLVAEAAGTLVGLARCEGAALQRFRHQAEFGICVLRQYGGKGIGKKTCWLAAWNGRTKPVLQR